ncbi:MAG: thioredoxin family protein [Bacteroidota bacterium]
MKMNMIKVMTLALGFFMLSAFTATEPLNIGAEAPMAENEMPGTDGENYSLKSAADKNGLLVVFSCNTCPFVIAWEDRYNELMKFANDNKVGMIVVNSNSARRTSVDSPSAMKEKVQEKNYQFPYVVDEGNRLADAFGAAKTPDVFLFNGDMELAYKGAIDNSGGGRQDVSEEYLMDAISKMVAGKKIDPNSTKAIGCTIKRS